MSAIRKKAPKVHDRDDEKAVLDPPAASWTREVSLETMSKKDVKAIIDSFQGDVVNALVVKVGHSPGLAVSLSISPTKSGND
jgi:hypothetical protein